MGKLRIAIVGCGGIANQKHMPSIKTQADKAEMVAFCDIIPERAEKAAKEASEKANIKAVKNMIQFNISKNMILTKYSETEYEQAVKELEEEEAE